MNDKWWVCQINGTKARFAIACDVKPEHTIEFEPGNPLSIKVPAGSYEVIAGPVAAGEVEAMLNPLAAGRNLVGLLLDESGSMQSDIDETINAVNGYFDDLAKTDALVTFATFESGRGVVWRNTLTPVRDIDRLNRETYKPGEYTPLLDAVGKMLRAIEADAKPNDKVIVVVVTDGKENRSREFDLATIRYMIAEFEGKGWAFSYIGVSPDAWGEHRTIGASEANSLSSDSVRDGLTENSRAAAAYFAGRVSSRNLYAEPIEPDKQS